MYSIIQTDKLFTRLRYVSVFLWAFRKSLDFTNDLAESVPQSLVARHLVSTASQGSWQGHREGGQKNTMTTGSMDFGWPIEISMWGLTSFFLEITWFWPKNTLEFQRRPFFFGDHIIIWTKLRHFLRLFWCSQNRKSVIFEPAPGLRSALGAPGSWFEVFSK